MRGFIFAATTLLLVGQMLGGPRAAAQISDPVIVLERESDVFQTAPAYRLSIFADGTVVFAGSKHVKSQEPIGTKIDKDQLTSLLSEFDRIKYYSLRNRYSEPEDGCPQRFTDHPYVTTTLNVGGKKKSIVHYLGCFIEGESRVVFPEELYQLEARIDEVVNSKQWLEQR